MGKMILGRPRWRRLRVGCAVEYAERCLAMAVYARGGVWRVKWAEYGAYGGEDDDGFAKMLRKRVHRRPFWTHLAGHQSLLGQHVHRVDVDDSLTFREKREALRTQALGGLPNPDDSVLLLRNQQLGPETEAHSVGAVAFKDDIRREFKVVKRAMGIINPHLGSAAVGLANTYLALYPEEDRKRNPKRKVILMGRDYARTCVFDDWRLMATREEARDEEHGIWDWPELTFDETDLKDDFDPCLVRVDGMGSEPVDGVQVWDPFEESEGASVRIDNDEARERIREHPELAPIAFGMALCRG